MGLGISIAGGKGSTPFKGVDEVRTQSFSYIIRARSVFQFDYQSAVFLKHMDDQSAVFLSV